MNDDYFRIVGCMFGVAAAMKDFRDLNIAPDYLAMGKRMIELYEEYLTLRKANEPAKKITR